MARTKKPPLPKAGDAFAVPLEDGRYGVCRVLIDTTSPEAKGLGRGRSILVAGSAWIGDAVPTAADPALRPILRKTHHSWAGDPEVQWVDDAPPADFVLIGTIPPTADEAAMTCDVFGGWASFAIQPLAQWRWDHDQEAVIAADAERKARDAERGHEAQRERQNYLSRVTLADLRGHRFFPGWKDYPSRKLVAASRKIMADTVERLIALELTASEDARMGILRECIEAFNRLDAETTFIETVEREDICEEFEAVVHACGLGHHQDLADEWREW
jgi:hypothetical protein